MNVITNLNNFVSDAEPREISYIKYAKAKEKIAPIKEIFEIPVGKVTVVYNPYNPESLLAAAILKKHRKEYNYKAIQEIIPSNHDYMVWIGVNKIFPTKNVPFAKHVKHVDFSLNQPVKHVQKKLTVLDKLTGRTTLSKAKHFDNMLIEFLNGDVTTELDYQEIVYTSLIDKILLYFGLDDGLKYSYRHLSIMSWFWKKGTLTEAEDAAFYTNMKNANSFLHSSSKEEFKLIQPSDAVTAAYLEEYKKNFKLLENRTVFINVPTITGDVETAISTVDFTSHYAARRYFKSVGRHYLNVIHGANGGFLTGSVKLRKHMKYFDIDRYIDC